MRKQFFPTMDERKQMREEKLARENLQNSQRLHRPETQNQNSCYRYPEVHQTQNLESYPDSEAPPPPYEVVVLGHQPVSPSPSRIVTAQPRSGQVGAGLGPPESRPVIRFGENSIRVICPDCNSDVHTKLTYKVGNFIILATAVIMCFGCFFLPFCAFSCVPCCINSWKDVKHSCPNCRRGLGIYRR